MKNKPEKIRSGQLFFSQTWNFLNVYLVKQAGRSQATAESYRDSLTIFKNYLVGELGKSISTFQFSDCTKECIYNFTGDYNVVMSHIRNIREKIEDNPSKPFYIQTVWGVGYRFNKNCRLDKK